MNPTSLTKERVDQLAAALAATHARGGTVNDHTTALPSRREIAHLCDHILALLFPGYFSGTAVNGNDVAGMLARSLAEGEALLQAAIRLSGHFGTRPGEAAAHGASRARELAAAALEALPEVAALVQTDVDAAFANDPAAIDRATIILSYPCIEALAIQRFAHRLYRLGVPILPRMMTEIAHSRTGIDIHPGAAIGESFFIDHGTGVVIGETSRIGRNCVLYQGVGLVAWNPLERDEHGELRRGQSNKRHPDLEDHVTIYAGATILGGDTVIGHHSVIGGNVWVTRSVAPGSVVRNKEPELDIRQRRRQ